MLQDLLEEKVLPQAAVDGNRWLATWAFWMLGRRDRAVRALIVRPSAAAAGPILLIMNLVSNFHPTRDPGVAGFAFQVLPRKRPGSRGSIQAAQRKDIANAEGRINDLASSRMGFHHAECQTV